MKRWYFIILIIFAKCTFAQDVSFKALAPEVVEVGQQFRLTYSVNAKAQNFSAQAVNGINVLAGPSTSQSNNVSIVNGKVTQNFELRYTYIVQAMKEGNVTIPSAEVRVEGKVYKSNPLNIEVIKGNATQNKKSVNAAGINQTQANNSTQVSKDDLFLKVLVNKTKVHREEQVIVTVKLYSRLRVTQLGAPKFPAFDGFVSERIKLPPLNSLNEERIGNDIYLTGVLEKFILYPQKTGDLNIGTYSQDIFYHKTTNRRSRNMFDDLFGMVETEKINVLSNDAIIHVSTLPSNKPYNFSGAVGKLKLTASIDNNSVKTNDAINLKVKLSGSGNIKYINPLDIEFPSDFDVYDPKVNDNIKYSEQGAIGNKTFEYLMIPRHAGDFTIPAFSFTYFDTEQDQYKTEKAGPFKITVAKSEGDTTVTVSSVFNKEDVRFFGKDIRFIKKNENPLKSINKFFFGSLGFYLVYIIGFLIFTTVFIFRKKMMKQNANVMLVKNKKANKFARKRLNKASGFMKQNQNESFYEELVKALWGYISDKLGIPVADLSKDNARNEMITRDVDQEYIEQVLSIIDRCEYARYAPDTADTKMDVLYNDAIKVISKLQQKLK
jgi:hypothetical protein